MPDTELRAQRDSVDRTFVNSDCSTLTTAVRADIAAMKTASDNEQREMNAAPVTVVRAFERFAGSQGAGDVSVETLAKTKAHAAELNSKIAAKDCAKIDVEAELHASQVKEWVPASDPKVH